MSKLIVISVYCLLLTSCAVASPIWLDQLFGVPKTFNNPQANRPSQPSRQPRDRFRPICRVISGDNYAFRGRVPYPSAPFCPFGNKK